MTVITRDEEKVENPEVYRAMEELEKAISNTAEIVVELESRLKSVFRDAASLPNDAIEQKPNQPFTAPLAQDIKGYENRTSDLRDKIAGMLFRLEI